MIPRGHTESGVDPSVKSKRVRLLVTIVLVGMVVSIAFHYVGAYWFGWGYPRSTFLFRPEDHLNDWNNTYGYAQALFHGQPAPFVYFPFAFLVTGLATLLPIQVGLALMIVLFLEVLALMLRRWVVDLEEHSLVRLQYVFILVALSYPVLMALDRANQELLVFLFIAGFLYFLYVRKPAWLAAVFLAAAIAYKLYPAVFLLLLLAERRVRLVVLTIVVALAMTAAGTALLALVGGYSLSTIWQMNSAEKARYQMIQVTNRGGIQHSHSLWGMTQVPGLLKGTSSTHLQTTLYSLAVAAIFLLIAVHVVFREKERWKQVLLVTVAAILLPFVSGDYTLIQLYFPLLFFVNSPRVSRWNLAYVAMFAILLVPVDYHYLSLADDGVSISVIVYPLALMALAVLAVLDPAPRHGDPAGGPSL